MWEDNFPETYSVFLESTVVESNFRSGGAGSWRKLGPYTRTISDGTINISTQGGHSNISGVEIWTASAEAGLRLAANARNATGSNLEEKERMADGPELTVFPNPSINYLTIAFTPKETAFGQVAILNLQGAEILNVFDGPMLSGERQEFTVDTRDLVRGLYVIKVINGPAITYRRHIIAQAP